MVKASERQESIKYDKSQFKKESRKLLLKRFKSNKLITFGSMIVFLLLVISIFGPLFTTFGPLETDPSNRLEGPSSIHLFGTDNVGRDLFSRIIYGARSSMFIALSITLISSLIGLAIGLYASYYKSIDNILMRIADSIMAIPPLLLAIALMASLGASTANVIGALSFVFIPNVARVTRSAALVISEETYIEVMKAQGASSWRIIWLHIAPNTLSQLIVEATFIFANSIVVEATLSFLGAGIPAPDPSWGNILYEGKQVITIAWWLVVFPGISIVLSVLGVNLFGDGLRDVLDPETKM